MARTLSLIFVAVALAGCARTTLLTNRNEGSQTTATSTTPTTTATTGTPTTTTTTPSPAALAYLVALSREQAKLAAAERKIPRGARTAAGLSHSIQLLRAAIVRLERDLQAISPPSSVAAQHAQLVSIMRAYADRLRAAAHTAGRPGAQLRAANMLISATTTASEGFSSTVNQINAAVRQ
jgi:hypothetical protein